MHKILRENGRLQYYRKFLLRQLSSRSSKAPNDVFCSFDEFVCKRQAEATRSIVVQVSSEKSYNELYNYCCGFGKIIGAHHYQVQSEGNLHYILVEYENREEAAAAIDNAAYNEDQSGVPVCSPFLWFKAVNKRAVRAADLSIIPDLNLSVKNGTEVVDNTNLNNLLQAAKDIETQIQLLYQRTKLNDLGVRLRFLAALQIQKAISGMFPAASAQPFGSSVNGFGKMGCDLDLILRFDSETSPAKQYSDSRLIFHTKENLSNGRSQVQRQMESIGDMLHLFLPGVCHVRRILQARVPIIKYHHEHLNLEVDLSMSNLSGFYMSELLYMFGELDARVRPLTFCVRRWASACGLTNPSPGRWISNFSLTCLVVFFLQQIKNPILPTINSLIKSATEADMRVTEDGINCTFSRDLEKIAFQTRNQSAISELLLQFFEFYSQFDFQNRALSLNEGRSISKPDHSALYIVNPLEQVLNVSKNVSLEECERLRIEVRNAAWLLESEVENTKIPENEKLETPWGLLNLFKTPEKSIIRPNFFFKPRMVRVSDLFDGQDKEMTLKKSSANTSNSKNTSTSPSTATGIDFKNASVKQQVQQIKAQNRNDLKQLRMNSTSGSNSSDSSTSKSRRNR